MERAATEYGILTLVALTLACSGSGRAPIEDAPPRPRAPQAAPERQTAVGMEIPGAIAMHRIEPAPALALSVEGVLKRVDGVYSFSLADSRPQKRLDPEYTIKDGDKPRAIVTTLGSNVRRYSAVHMCSPGRFVDGQDVFDMPGNDMRCVLQSAILLTPDVKIVRVQAFGEIVAEIPRAATPGPSNPAALLGWGHSNPTLFAHADPSSARVDIVLYGLGWKDKHWTGSEPAVRTAWRKVPLCKHGVSGTTYVHIGWGLDWVSFELDAEEWIADGLNKALPLGIDCIVWDDE